MSKYPKDKFDKQREKFISAAKSTHRKWLVYIITLLVLAGLAAYRLGTLIGLW